MEIDAKRQLIEEKLNGLIQSTGEEANIICAVHGVFELYDTDKDGQLSDEEARPFFINFNQLVIGMAPELGHDQEII